MRNSRLSEQILSSAWYAAAMTRQKKLPDLTKMIAEATGDTRGLERAYQERAMAARDRLRALGALAVEP